MLSDQRWDEDRAGLREQGSGLDVGDRSVAQKVIKNVFNWHLFDENRGCA